MDQNRYSISQFVQKTQQQDKGQGVFEFETDRILEINLHNTAWIKAGSMVSYRGAVQFTREGILEHGLGKLLKNALTGEGLRLTKAEGRGKIYLSDMGKKVSILNLNNESIFINGNDVLAFEPHLKWDIRLMRKLTGLLSGGLFNIRFEGSGLLAITSHYDPLTLNVTKDEPVYTDPNATIAWSGNLTPELKTDITLKTFFGRGSGESIQMKFEGEGFVVVQPYEEVYFQASNVGIGL